MFPTTNLATPKVFLKQARILAMAKKLDLPNVDCVHLTGPGPQSGANITKGFNGNYPATTVPNKKPYWQSNMCPVNVHWHLGTEHYSVGEYDENGNGPDGNIAAPKFTRRLASGEPVRPGFRCHHYDAKDSKFTKDYDWKHCKGMKVGETYEVHWPHSGAGACGTIDQYQTPFYDGVFCKLGLTVPEFVDLVTNETTRQTVPNVVGVQGQIFTVVDDESYFYPDMIRGWVHDEERTMATDIAYYTGSTTGTSRNNEICSQYAPITWQVDRKCHMISASSFDKLCYDMKLQRDDMTYDLEAHGSRELVHPNMVANNMERKRRLHEHSHEHSHSHGDHEHDHDHEEWF